MDEGKKSGGKDAGSGGAIPSLQSLTKKGVNPFESLISILKCMTLAMQFKDLSVLK